MNLPRDCATCIRPPLKGHAPAQSTFRLPASVVVTVTAILQQPTDGGFTSLQLAMKAAVLVGSLCGESQDVHSPLEG